MMNDKNEYVQRIQNAHKQDNEKQADLVSEMMSRYPDEWIFFEVLSEDKYGVPFRGRLITHDPDQEVVENVVRERRDLYDIAVWYSGELVPDGELVLL
jgi:hypothetical protein